MIRRLTFWALICAGVGFLSWLWPRLDRPPSDFEIGRQYLDDGRADLALLFFEKPAWRGVAEYRAGRFAHAVAQFGAQQNVVNLYNRGNAFAQLEDWDQAIAAYRRVLRYAPDHADAKHNLDLVLRAAATQKGGPTDAPTKPEETLPSGMELKATIPQSADSVKSQAGEKEQSDTAGNTSDTDEIGEATQKARADSVESAGEIGSGAAIGKPAEEEDGEQREVVGSARLKTRESRQAAELLLRKIHDDPEKVLRARLNFAHKLRNRGGAE